jgi:ABC-2 type transport system permease protein
MIERVRSIIVKEFRQIYRDKRTLGLLIVIPAFLLVLMGYAINFDVKHIPIGVFDEERSSSSREFIRALTTSEYFDLEVTLESGRGVDELIERGDVRVVLIIPRDFSRDLLAGRTASVQVLVDAADANTASIAIGYIEAISADYSAKIGVTAMQRLGHSSSPPLDFRPRIWYNPELRSAKFLIPGLIGFILTITAVISTAMSIVREKERGTMEQIVVSPIKPAELIIGKMLPFAFIAFISTTLILLAGCAIFDVSIRGSIVLLYLTTFFFILAALGIGLFISTVATTQQYAFQLSALVSLLPTMILSGFVFPIRSMPIALQFLSNITPAKFYLIALRSIILKGVGLSAFWPQILYLILFAGVLMTVSALRFQKRLT